MPRTSVLRSLKLATVLMAGALVAFALAGAAPVNYDTVYGLAWGQQLAHGDIPDLRVALAPTPKPLLTLVAAPLTALGADTAQALTQAGAFAALGALALVAGLLAAQLGEWAAGVGAWALVLTRVPVLSFGARAYVDVPYCALVLGAVAIEARRRRAGPSALALLAVAGLLRPEAWLMAVAYAAYCAYPAAPRQRALLAALALAAPVAWLAHDALLAGDPLWSLTGTRTTGQVLERPTGILTALGVAPRRVGEIVREPVLVAAVLGIALAVIRRRRRELIVLAALIAASGSFVLMAGAGLPTLGRYLMLPALLLVVLAAGGTAAGLRRGGWWRVTAVAALALLMVLLLPQARRIGDLRQTLRAQAAVLSDAEALLDTPGAHTACGPWRTPNHRLVPLVALRLDRSPAAVLAGLGAPGTSLVPRTPRVAQLTVLDPRDPAPTTLEAPPGARRVAVSRDWVAAAACAAP